MTKVIQKYSGYTDPAMSKFFKRTENDLQDRVIANRHDENKAPYIEQGRIIEKVDSGIISRGLIKSEGASFHIGNSSDKTFNVATQQWMQHSGMEMEKRDLQQWSSYPDIETVASAFLHEGEEIPDEDFGVIGSRQVLIGTVAAAIEVTRRANNMIPYDMNEYAVSNTILEFGQQIQSMTLVGQTGLAQSSGVTAASDVDTQDASGGSKAAVEAGIQAVHTNRGNPNLLVANPATKTALMQTSFGTGFAWRYDATSPTGQSCFGLPAAVDTALDAGVAVLGDFRQGGYMLIDNELELRSFTGQTMTGGTQIYAFLDFATIIRGKLFSVISNIS